MANCRKVTAFADWPCNVLGRLPIGDKLPTSGHGGDPAAMVDLMVMVDEGRSEIWVRSG